MQIIPIYATHWTAGMKQTDRIKLLIMLLMLGGEATLLLSSLVGILCGQSPSPPIASVLLSAHSLLIPSQVAPANLPGLSNETVI